MLPYCCSIRLDSVFLITLRRCSIQRCFWPTQPKYFVAYLRSCMLANIPHVEALTTLYFSTSGQSDVQMLKKKMQRIEFCSQVNKQSERVQSCSGLGQGRGIVNLKLSPSYFWSLLGYLMAVTNKESFKKKIILLGAFEKWCKASVS